MTTTIERCEQDFMAGSICSLPKGHSGPHRTQCVECLADMNADEHAAGCSYADDPEEALVNAPWITEARAAMAEDRLGRALWEARRALDDVKAALPPEVDPPEQDPARSIAYISVGLAVNALDTLEAALA